MASLREIKDRIGSVRSTLKITSAMKLVASAKLRKAQKAIEGMRPYERTLTEILAAVGPLRPGAPIARRPSSLPAGAGTGFGATNPAAAEPSPPGSTGAALFPSGGVSYFPAYEILMDELRDYRFYAEDLVHPSSAAVQIVWERFLDSCTVPAERERILAAERAARAAQHRPLQ